jgi:hypothetical protein
MNLTISVEKIYEPFEYSDDGGEANDDPFHPRPSLSNVESPVWDDEVVI